MSNHSDFVQRSKDRSRQRRIIRELFQSGEMPVKMFKHLTRLVEQAQHLDSRRTGFTYRDGEFV